MLVAIYNNISIDENGKLDTFGWHVPDNEFDIVTVNNLSYHIKAENKINPFYAMNKQRDVVYFVIGKLGDRYIIIECKFGMLSTEEHNNIEIIYTSENKTYDDIVRKQKRLII